MLSQWRRGKEQKTGACIEQQNHVVYAAEAKNCPHEEGRSAADRGTIESFPTNDAERDDECGVTEGIAAYRISKTGSHTRYDLDDRRTR
jgi:hypothetical protein